MLPGSIRRVPLVDRSRGSWRYTVEFHLTGGDSIQIRAVTPADEPMAVCLAYARLLILHPDVRFHNVTIAGIETEWKPDPENDAVDYWNMA